MVSLEKNLIRNLMKQEGWSVQEEQKWLHSNPSIIDFSIQNTVMGLTLKDAYIVFFLKY